MAQKQISEVRTTQRDSGEEQRIFSFKASQWIWLGLGVLESLIGLRFILKLFAANPESPFAAFVYNLSALFLAPFSGLLGEPSAGGMVFESSSIIAMIVYGLLAWGLERIVRVSFYRPRGSGTRVGVTKTEISEPDVITQTTTLDE